MINKYFIRVYRASHHQIYRMNEIETDLICSLARERKGGLTILTINGYTTLKLASYIYGLQHKYGIEIHVKPELVGERLIFRYYLKSEIEFQDMH